MGMIDAVKIMRDAELKAESNKITLGEYEAMIRPLRQVMTKADYENRLKADMVAMLEEIQAQIDDLWEATWNSDYRGGFKDGCIESNNIIQQKINSLKEA